MAIDLKEHGTRINLWVYVRDDNGRVGYHTLHIGFFPARNAASIVAGLDAVGLAYHCAYPGQTGNVDVMTCDMRTGLNADWRACSHAYQPHRERAEPNKIEPTE